MGRVLNRHSKSKPRNIVVADFSQTGKGWCLLAADTSAARSIIKMKGDEDKIRQVGSTLIFTYNGEAGDTIQFAEYVEANLKLDTIRNHSALLPAPAASWVRKTLAESIRSRHPYSVNLLLGGFDPTESAPHLYWLDYLGTIAKVPYAAHGYASYLTLSTMDRYHDPDMSLEEGLQLLRRCINELEKRLVINLGAYKVRVVDESGVRDISEDFARVRVELAAP